MRSYGIRSTTVAVDDFRCFPVAGVLDRNKALWGAFVIETPAGRVPLRP